MSACAKTRDRIPCVNLSCRRTAASDKFPDQEIVCAKCWPTVPKALRRRHSQTKARCKKLLTKLNNRYRQGQISAERADKIWDAANEQRVAAWTRIKDYLNHSPAPHGIEEFLKENGLA